jgi:hypothetical protein
MQFVPNDAIDLAYPERIVSVAAALQREGTVAPGSVERAVAAAKFSTW